MVKIKICGVRDLAVARACIEHRVDLVGLNFVPSSKRRIDLEHAKELVAVLKAAPWPRPQPVGVFMDAAEEEINEVASTLDLHFVQLHGSEPPPMIRSLAARYSVIKAVTADRLQNPKALLDIEACVTFFLFDGRKPGSGQRFEWSALSELPIQKPFFLAGGLTPNNVSEAIKAVEPFGVDTASGIETDGVPDPDKVHEFTKRARERRGP